MKVLFIGDCSIDEYYALEGDWPLPGSKARAKFMETRYGGMMANAAASLACCGAESILFTGLGTDKLHSQAILNDLQDFGVNTHYIQQEKSIDVPKCLILTDGQERLIYVVEPAHTFDFMAQPQRLFNLIKECDFIYTSIRDFKTLYSNPQSNSIFKDGSCRTFIDCDAIVELEDLKIIRNARILSFNEFGYSKIIREITATGLNKELFEQGQVETLIITKGKEGCQVITPEQTYSCPAYRKDAPPQDTTGAGDAFNSTFLFGLLSGFSRQKTMQLANKAGFMATQKQGPRSKFTVEELLMDL